MGDVVDRKELLELAREAAHAAGDLILDGLIAGVPSVESKSLPADLVSSLDRSAEGVVVEMISSRRPGDGFVGEETGERPGNSGIRWLIDPVDGTANLVHGHPSFAVSVAAEAHDEVVVGAVFDPLRAEMFSALIGHGAYRDGRTLAASDRWRLQHALVGTGFHKDMAARSHQVALLNRVVTHVGDVRISGSAALDLCWVAAGRIDAYYESALQPWDHAAGALIAAEAGAWVRDIQVAGPVGDVILAAPEPLATALVALLHRETSSGTHVGSRMSALR